MSEQAKKSYRRYLPLLGLPAVLGPALIFVFILRTEAAHDEDVCPYITVSERDLSDGSRIVEQSRSCVEGVEDRRYLLRRSGQEQVLGRRRFDEAAFAAPAYGWDAGVSDAGEVSVEVTNPGHEPMRFREGLPGEE